MTRHILTAAAGMIVLFLAWIAAVFYALHKATEHIQ